MRRVVHHAADDLDGGVDLLVDAALSDCRKLELLAAALDVAASVGQRRTGLWDMPYGQVW